MVKKLRFMLLLLLGILIPLTSLAYNVEVDGIYYNLDDVTLSATVTYGENMYTGDVSIPSTINVSGTDYTVTSIGGEAFFCCSSLSSITIPNSVTSIGDRSFVECRSLSSITIPNSVTSIGNYAFNNCVSLSSITIPNSVVSIGSYAFGLCSSLSKVYCLTTSTPELGSNVFEGIAVEATLYLLSESDGSSWSPYFMGNIEAISTTFTDANNIKYTLDIETLTASVSDGKSCNSNDIIIPEAIESQGLIYMVKSIGDYAFRLCTLLSSVTIPNSVTSIGASAFYKCTSLSSVSIPNSVTSIGASAFCYCI